MSALTALVVPLAFALFALGFVAWGGARAPPRARVALLVLCVPAALVAALFPAYFLHLKFLDQPWYYELRSREWADLLPALGGLSCGVLAGVMHQRRQGRDRAWLRVGAGLVVLLLLVSFAKPWLTLVRPAVIRDEWRGGVCLQSTPSTCGPCAAATVLRALGVPAKESELAHEARASRTGTQNWMLARALRRRGLEVAFDAPERLDAVAAPAVVGVFLSSGAGHFVAWLGERDGRYVVGDPLEGELVLTPEEFARRYRFGRFALLVRSP